MGQDVGERWLKGRCSKAKARVLRIRRLARAARPAAKLYRTGAWSQLSYGAEVAGVPPSELARWRSLAAAATGVPRSSCTTSAIAIEHGVHEDPAVKMRLKQLSQWAQLWGEADDGMRRRIRRVWTLAYRTLSAAEARRRWHGIIGPIGATIATILDIGWKPIARDFWQGPDWSWQITGEWFTSPSFEASLTQAVLRPLWEHAARHFGGGGLGDGGDVSALRRHLATLRRNGKAQDAALLQTIGAGGAWSESRFADAGLWSSARCLRCGADRGTPLHAYWECPDNKCIEDDAVRDTQHLAKRALADGAPECFWTRGVVPASWTATTPASEFNDHEMAWGNQNLFASSEGDVRWATDGSGGEHSDKPPLRRCGWAAIVARFDADNPESLEPLEFAARFGPLPSCKQTVPRAEAFGLLRLQQLAGPGELTAVIDAKSVVDGAANLDRAAKSGNGDLWTEIRADSRGRPGRLIAKKVKSHAEERHFAAGLDPRDAVANEIADIFADKGAALAALPCSETGNVELVNALARKVQKRLLRIAQRCLEFRPPRETIVKRSRKRRVTELTVADAEHSSQHIVCQRARWKQCEVCGARPLKAGRLALLEFLRSPCVAGPTQESAAVERSDDTNHRTARAPSPGHVAPAEPDDEDVFGHGFGLDNDDGVAALGGQDRPGDALDKGTGGDCGDGSSQHLASVVARSFGQLPGWWTPQIGKAGLHPTHRFGWHRGFTWCWRCGLYAGQVARGLRKPCRNGVAKHNAQTLRRLRDGLPPAPGLDWLQPDFQRHDVKRMRFS